MKKGFTLIELIGVILIITLIFALAYPSFVKVISTNNERALQSQINEIIKSGKLWASEYMNSVLVETNPQYVKVSELYNLGLLDKNNIINPVTKESMNDNCVKVSVNDYNSYNYEFIENC